MTGSFRVGPVDVAIIEHRSVCRWQESIFRAVVDSNGWAFGFEVHRPGRFDRGRWFVRVMVFRRHACIRFGGAR